MGQSVKIREVNKTGEMGGRRRERKSRGFETNAVGRLGVEVGGGISGKRAADLSS